MSEPLGRDRLGRLMYACDVGALDILSPLGRVVVTGYDSDFDIMLRVYDNWHTVSPSWLPDHFAVDLAASPKRTFYERYFADLGPIEYIDTCYVESASQADDDDLFWFDFEHDLWWYFDHANFMTWLQQEATV